MDGAYDDCEHDECTHRPSLEFDADGPVALGDDSCRHRRAADRRGQAGVQHQHTARATTSECAERIGDVRTDRSCGHAVAASPHQIVVGEADHDAMDDHECARLRRQPVRRTAYDNARCGDEFANRRPVRDGGKVELLRDELSRLGQSACSDLELREGIQFVVQYVVDAGAACEQVGGVRFRTSELVQPDAPDDSAALSPADDALLPAGSADEIRPDAVQLDAGAARRRHHTENMRMKIARQ